MRYLLAGLACLATPAFAEVPKVVADIGPVRGIAAAVMGDLATPDVILPPGASPHGYAMRPSEAKALSEADLVVWVGPKLTNWMERQLEILAEGAKVVTWEELDGLTILARREVENFSKGHGDDHDDHDHAEDGHDDHDDHEGHDHAEHEGHDDHKDDDHAGHDHDDHKDDDHAEEAGHDDHGHDDHGHAHGPEDSHIWLSVDNARVLVETLTKALSEMDPENAATYQANAASALSKLDAAETRVRDAGAKLKDRAYVVGHDAFQYVEALAGIAPVGTITLANDTPPSPGQLKAVTEAFAENDVACVFIRPGLNTQLVAQFVPEGVAKVEVNPLGTHLAADAEYYPNLIGHVADGYEACAK